MFWHLLSLYKYPVLFLGVFLGGDTALLIGVFLSLVGVMSLWYVVGITFVASLAADAFWYWIGYFVSYEHIKRLPYFRSHTHHVEALQKFVDIHGSKTILYSKFVYGTRTLVQILCGTHKFNLVRYFVVNIIGTVLWIGIMVGVGTFIHARVHTYHHLARNIEVTFTLLVVAVVALHILVKKLFIDKL